MKFLFAATLFLIPALALACKPGPLPKCKQPAVTLKHSDHKKLNVAVDSFQTLLTETLAESDKLFPNEQAPRNSCFNNHFAQHYLLRLKDFADSHGNKICTVHAGWVATQVRRLIEEKSLEWQAVKVDRRKLQTRAKKVSEALAEFLASHDR